MVHVKRHIAKAISYRFVGTFTTIVISYMFTGNIVVASGIGFVEFIVKPLNYFIHERIWYNYIRFGVIDKDES
jgi:uncharacterized membrane protein